MRSPVILLIFFFTTASAQVQERSLIDRLLRPNMDLQNEAQGKAFVADSKVAAKPGSAGTFVLKSSAKQKTFQDTRAATAKEYRSGSSRTDLRGSSFVQTQDAAVTRQFVSSSPAHDIHAACDARLAVSGRSFGDERVFREEGKSQKSLNRKNPPLTIDQVRELLNKNK